MTEYPALRLLIKAYYDEDWSDESAGDADTVLRSFKEGEADLVPALLREIESLSEQGERRCAEVVKALGPYYDLEGDGFTYQSWLVHVSGYLSSV